MDLRDPTRALTPTLDGPVLAVLAAAGRPLTVGQIAAEATRGSEIGIRRSVARLVEQGLVSSVQMGRNQVMELNRDHLAAPAAELLAGLRLELWRRLRETLGGWDPKPVYACVFGSAARHDGGTESDVDLLLVRQPLPGESPPRTEQKGVGGLLEPILSVASGAVPLSASRADAWHAHVDDLHGRVIRWTGNPLHVVDIPVWTWMNLDKTEPALFAEICRDGVMVAGSQPVFPSRTVR